MTKTGFLEKVIDFLCTDNVNQKLIAFDTVEQTVLIEDKNGQPPHNYFVHDLRDGGTHTMHPHLDIPSVLETYERETYGYYPTGD